MQPHAHPQPIYLSPTNHLVVSGKSIHPDDLAELGLLSMQELEDFALQLHAAGHIVLKPPLINLHQRFAYMRPYTYNLVDETPTYYEISAPPQATEWTFRPLTGPINAARAA